MGRGDIRKTASSATTYNATGAPLVLADNAPITKARIAKAVGGVEAETCPLCRQETETIEHFANCPAVLDAYARVQRGAGLPHVPGGMQTLMLQEEMDGGTRAAVIAFYVAAWATRRTCRRLDRRITPEQLADVIMTCLECPWLIHCCSTTTQKERRAGRIRPPTGGK